MEKEDMLIVLAGNPNVGKSTVFNYLTGLRQHTGNWTGKTVENASGKVRSRYGSYTVADVPGTYSLLARSAEEEAARDMICFGGADGVIAVCDASCLERNLALVLQIAEVTDKVTVCVNLMDEAEKKGVCVDLKQLSVLLGVNVCGTAARQGKGVAELARQAVCESGPARKICYSQSVEAAAGRIAKLLDGRIDEGINRRWAALKLLENDEGMVKSLERHMQTDNALKEAVKRERGALLDAGEDPADVIAACIIETACRIAAECVRYNDPCFGERDRKIDRILTHRIWGLPVMLVMLGCIFWLTVKGANYPSQLLSAAFDSLGGKLKAFLDGAGAPVWLNGLLMDGIYRVVTWVTAVMLPPMAIFFPLFTLLEDLGYLPRVAFNLDSHFKKAGACGKQSLTMAMGFGCNAVGITGCRIIDSPRERLIAMLTNSFAVCNGRFPGLIAIITMYFAAQDQELAVLILTVTVAGGVLLTLGVSKLLSLTLLKGEPSSFILELPPYRRPQVVKTLIRSVLDRTVFVLGRAVAVAAPAGAVIWILGNVTAGGVPVTSAAAQVLDPVGRFFGMDGTILLSFLLGFPANEIVVPLMMMIYSSGGTVTEYESLASLKQVLDGGGWTLSTAVCTVIFMVSHFPCSTALLTIKKETGSLKWTVAAFLIPLVTGLLLCFIASRIIP